MQPYVGDIEIFGFNFAPVGWLPCDGRLISISENEVLYTLLGTTYGGNGTTTFGLPDFRGRAAVHYGQGPGLQNYVMGASSGTETVTLTGGQMPAHTHPVLCQTAAGDKPLPTNNYFATEGSNQFPIYASTAAGGTLAPSSITTAGGSQPHDNLSPYLALNYCIATVGIYPPQS